MRVRADYKFLSGRAGPGENETARAVGTGETVNKVNGVNLKNVITGSGTRVYDLTRR